MKIFDWFITGCPRSGTTILSRRLSGSGKYLCLCEPFMFERNALHACLEHFHRARLTNRKLVLKEVFQDTKEPQGGRTSTLQVPYIAEYMAHKTLWLIREPKHIWRSMVKSGWYQQETAAEFCECYQRYMNELGWCVLDYNDWVANPMESWFQATGEMLFVEQLGDLVFDHGCPRAMNTDIVMLRDEPEDFQGSDYDLIDRVCGKLYESKKARCNKKG